MMKLLIIALNGTGRTCQGGDRRGNIANVQCKAIQNYHNKSPHPMNVYMLIKILNPPQKKKSA
jgi:hypothetical protein